MTDKALVKQSPWFDPQWYRTRYPDVDVSGLGPVEHYTTLGEKWGRWAGPFFHSGFYRNQYPDIVKAGISPLLHFTQYGESEGRWPFALTAQRLELLLWEEASPGTYFRLNEMAHGKGEWEASYAHWALARWHAWKSEWQACNEHLARRNELGKKLPATPAPYLLEIDVLIQQGHFTRALECIAALAQRYPGYGDTHLALANLLHTQQRWSEKPAHANAFSEALRLYHINALYDSVSLAPLVLADAQKPLTLENLACRVSVSNVIKSDPTAPLVSVIVPVYNAEAYLLTALESLAHQTYTHLEVLIIDDASIDDSNAIAQAFCEKDDRFCLITQSDNQGAYAARNRGLEIARGELITVHDSDDWSHPQKLECQVEGLNQHPEWKACFSDWVRATTQLQFARWRIESMDGWVHRNTSSFMFRRDVFETLGFWDVVNVEGDGEYFLRLVAAWGPKACGNVKKGIPLAFGRSLPNSLSQAGPTHLITQFKGLRHDYRLAATQWHASAGKPGDLYVSQYPKVRPFPAPQGNVRA